MDDARDALPFVLRVDCPDVDAPAAPSQFVHIIRPARRDAARSHDVGGGRDGDEDAALLLLHSLRVGARLVLVSTECGSRESVCALSPSGFLGLVAQDSFQE